MPDKFEFNINNYVEFTLSERGAEVVNKYEKSLNTRLPNIYSQEGVYKAGDACRMQLWSVMKIFGGSSIGLGQTVFCKDCIISFDVKEDVNV